MFSYSNSSDITKNTNGKEYIYPLIMVSDPLRSNAHCEAPKLHPEWELICEDFYAILTSCLNTRPFRVIDYNRSFYADLCVRKPYSFEFPFKASADLLSWLLDSEVGDTGWQLLKKAVVSPADSDHSFRNVAYLTDESRIYMYYYDDAELKILNKGGDELYKIINGDGSLPEYSITREAFPNSPIRQDMRMIIRQTERRALYNLQSQIPEFFSHDERTSVVAEMVLGADAISYIPDVDNITGAVVYKNIDSFYKIYPDGILEYSYLERDARDKGSIYEAYVKAVEFLHKKPFFPKDGSYDIYLSHIEENDDSFVFYFDYVFLFGPSTEDGKIFFSEYETNTREREIINNAIKTEANSRRVLSSVWAVRNFEARTSDIYNVAFTRLVDKSAANNPDAQMGLIFEDIEERGILMDNRICYFVTRSPAASSVLSPQFFLKFEKKSWFFDMEAE